MPVTFASSKTSVATIVGNMITIVGPGTSKITASQMGNPNFNAATIAQGVVGEVEHMVRLVIQQMHFE